MSISRLQLAAALLEYDNDSENPSRPPISHRDSAIFQPYRQRPLDDAPPPDPHVPLRPTFRDRPSSLASPGFRESVLEEREELEEPEDVDVSRWGLPSHLLSPAESVTARPTSASPMSPYFPKDIEKAPMQARSPSTRVRTVSASLPVPEPMTSPLHERAQSVYIDVLGAQDRPNDALMDPRERNRRVSYGPSGATSALMEAERLRSLVEGRPKSAFGDLERAEGERRTVGARRISNPIMVPLPSSPASASYARPYSSLSQNIMLSPRQGGEEELDDPDTPNPFALPAPPPELGSRFDPKVLTAQRRSSVSSAADQSRPDTRMSMASIRRSTDLGASHTQPQVYADIPSAEEYNKPLRPNRYSTLPMRPTREQVLRPKVLVMPAPLQGETLSSAARGRDGFVLGEKPLPAAARTSILSLENARPALPMSWSQRTFRDSLALHGMREGSGDAGEDGMGREDGDEEDQVERKPGKLYGVSLIDQLEHRKQVMRGKQRVFTGDSRPAMMARSSQRSTLIDPASLAQPSLSPTSPVKQTSSRPVSMQPGPGGRPPLLQFDTNDTLAVPDVTGRIPKSNSVLGVDQLWEREMAKLRMIEESDRKAKEEADERERQREERKKRKREKKDKAKGRILAEVLSPISPLDLHPEEVVLPGVSPIKRTENLPPVLQYSPEKAPTRPEHLLAEQQPEAHSRSTSRLGVGGWFGSSDEEGDEEALERRKSKGKGKEKAVFEPEPQAESSDEEDDVPLSRIAPSHSLRSVSARVQPEQPESSSDEDGDVPLSRLVVKSPVKPTGSLGLSIPELSDGAASKDKDNDNNDDDEDDDVPLYLKMKPGEGDDDVPLGLRVQTRPQPQQYQPPQYGNPMWGQMPQLPNLMYGYGYPMPMGMGTGMPIGHGMGTPMGMGMPMGYGSPSMPNLQMGMGMDMGMMSPYQAGFGMQPPPPPPQVSIDSWRKEVPLEPVATGDMGVRDSRSS
ncbi:hypothetical protein P7C73_g982, partial [Tremellales sp. Uapishka_1]